MLSTDQFINELRERFFDLHLTRTPTGARFHTPIEWKCFIEKEERFSGVAEMKALLDRINDTNHVPPAISTKALDVPDTLPEVFPEFTFEKTAKIGLKERFANAKKRLESFFQKSTSSV